MYNKSWKSRPSLNTGTKILSKVSAERSKKYLPAVISANQTAYVDGRVITKGGRLISDISHTTDLAKQKEFLVAVNIQKTFDSVNQIF